ncbi:MAG: 16S rRNA (adenine(1518)-N(6)/adenine(1519)-N(6))-dimethyltransferase RsmA [Chitinophagales bacterium]
MAKHEHIKLDKGLGQHFLADVDYLHRIVDTIGEHVGDMSMVEVGPGAGAMSEYFMRKENYKLIEYDERWANYLPDKYPHLEGKVFNQDFLQTDLNTLFDEEFAVIGNFPYNISSQILFKILDYKEKIPVMVGMFQKEVAERAAGKEGKKTYGILSVLLSAYYDTEYLFDVPREAFNPPPKVTSGVMMMKRKKSLDLPCDAKLLKQIVKMSFNQRRKTLRNSLKPMINHNEELKQLEIFDKRPEQLSVDAFFNLTNLIATNR